LESWRAVVESCRRGKGRERGRREEEARRERSMVKCRTGRLRVHARSMSKERVE
jgi:hypothetical protein